MTRLARGRRADGVNDMNACLALKPPANWGPECRATLDHATRNPTGATWTTFRDERDGVAFEHPADWDVLSTKTPKVFEDFLSAGLTRDAASKLAAAVKQNAGAFFIVNPYDATAMTVGDPDVGKVVPKDTVLKHVPRPVAADAAQFERTNASLHHGIRVRSNTLTDAGGAVRIDFTFGFELPIADTYLSAAGWRTMIFREVLDITARLEHICSQPLAAARDAVWARFTGSLDSGFWSPASRLSEWVSGRIAPTRPDGSVCRAWPTRSWEWQCWRHCWRHRRYARRRQRCSPSAIARSGS